ncbi:hypothetical protein [Lutibacter citreus]|uniref:hypothetical protein n=1 Tax=Lutibacter citreus TaxID=2138210 RepID=UPI001300BA6E|nr:hypothetical protein [Lutibacter citreus]
MKLSNFLIVVATFTIMISCSDSDSDIDEQPEIINEQPEEVLEEVEETEEENVSSVTIVEGIKYGPDFIVFEPEITKSDLGLWVKRTPEDSKYYKSEDIEAINKTYLEFTGNNLNGGNAKSPLTYTFTAPKTAKFRIVMRMYQPLLDGEAGDKRNDIWIKLAGDFTSACIYPTEDLKTNHKFWGRGVRKWGSLHNLEGHVNGVKKLAKVVYNLKEGKTYTLTISGRAQGCSIDYILLYDQNLGFNIVNHTDLAKELIELYRPEILN